MDRDYFFGWITVPRKVFSQHYGSHVFPGVTNWCSKYTNPEINRLHCKKQKKLWFDAKRKTRKKIIWLGQIHMHADLSREIAYSLDMRLILETNASTSAHCQEKMSCIKETSLSLFPPFISPFGQIVFHCWAYVTNKSLNSPFFFSSKTFNSIL